jgi:HEAT repeat protein
MEHDRLSRLLPDDVDRSEAQELDATWRMLGHIEAPVPNSERMRARLDAIIDAVGQEETNAPQTRPTVPGITRRRRTFVLQGLAAAAMLLIGVAIGRFGTSPSARTSGDATTELAAVRNEMRELREMVSLSLMRQQSASDRLKGVTWTGQLDRPSGDVVSALLDALMHDPNVNVRLATIDALERFASREDVRRASIDAVDRQASPLVQIALIDFLVNTNERQSAPTLKRLADNPQVNGAVRARAAWGLQQLG